MKEKVVIASGINGNELINSLVLHGINKKHFEYPCIENVENNLLFTSE